MNHATEVAKKISLDYDAIVTLSGDGLAHEILNGFAEHENPRAVFTIPLASVPTGSGNGYCCLSLMGLKVTTDSSSHPSSVVNVNAALSHLGRSRFSFGNAERDQGEIHASRPLFVYSKRSTNNLVNVCLMADLDINTEHLRWMGSARFIYGFLRGSALTHLVHTVTHLTLRSYLAATLPDKISLKVLERDKLKMHENHRSACHKQDEDRKIPRMV